MPRPKNETPSVRVRLDGYIRQPVTDPRVQKTLDWLEMHRGSRKAFPMAFDLLVAAVNGELEAKIDLPEGGVDSEKARDVLGSILAGMEF